MQYILLVIFFAMQVLSKNNSRIAVFCYSFFLIAFAIFAREGSWDYFGYIDYYECSISPSCSSVGFERSFSFVANLASLIAYDWGFALTFGFYVALAILIKLAMLRRYASNFNVALFSFICYGYFIHDLTQIRVSLAIAITWVGYGFWVERKKFPAILCIAIATFFHVSAILGLIVLAVSGMSTGLLLSATILAALAGQYMALNGVLPSTSYDRLAVYFNALGTDVFQSPQFSVYVVLMLATAVIGYANGLSNWSKFERCSISSLITGVILYFCFFYVPAVPTRLLDFFGSLYPFVAAASYRNAKSNLVKILIIFIMVMLFVNSAIRNNIRADLFFPWQAVNTDYLSEVQLNQFMQAND